MGRNSVRRWRLSAPAAGRCRRSTPVESSRWPKGASCGHSGELNAGTILVLLDGRRLGGEQRRRPTRRRRRWFLRGRKGRRLRDWDLLAAAGRHAAVVDHGRRWRQDPRARHGCRVPGGARDFSGAAAEHQLRKGTAAVHGLHKGMPAKESAGPFCARAGWHRLRSPISQ